MLPAFHAKGGSTQGGDVTVVESNSIPEKTNKSPNKWFHFRGSIANLLHGNLSYLDA